MQPISIMRFIRWIILPGFILCSFISMSQQLKKYETISLNGINTYYEVYGEGPALFLLHGFTQSSVSWKPFIPEYSRHFTIYLVDLLGHGRSDPFRETVSVKTAAKNLLDLIRYLKLDQIRAIGYSYGGEILFQLALLSPGLVSSMVIVGSCGTWKAREYPEFVEYLSYKNIEQLPWMREQQISEDRIKSILEQVPNYHIEISEKELLSVKTRTLLIVGDQDEATPLDCVVKAKMNMPGASLWVVPDTGHRVFQGENKPYFVEKTLAFLKQD